MARNRPKPTPPPAEPGGGGDAPEQREQAGKQERYGPLLVRRYGKDDGRALILYAHAGDEIEA